MERKRHSVRIKELIDYWTPDLPEEAQYDPLGKLICNKLAAVGQPDFLHRARVCSQRSKGYTRLLFFREDPDAQDSLGMVFQGSVKIRDKEAIIWQRALFGRKKTQMGMAER